MGGEFQDSDSKPPLTLTKFLNMRIFKNVIQTHKAVSVLMEDIVRHQSRALVKGTFHGMSSSFHLMLIDLRPTINTG